MGEAGFWDHQETAKAVVELPSPFAGVITALHEQPGTVVEVLSIHSLSYLNLWQARELFRTLHALMKPKPVTRSHIEHRTSEQPWPPDAEWRIGGSIDASRSYLAWGISIGMWH